MAGGKFADVVHDSRLTLTPHLVITMPRSRAQLEQAAADAEAWLDQLDPDDPNTTVDDPADLRAIAYALATVVSAEQAVAAARKNGRTWAEPST